MARKQFSAGPIVTKLRGADVLLSQERTVVEAAKQISITEQTC